jgi:aspartyl-tRNA(Asn)/glutamyl-tRNA(Gln) amidotransferase subunit A
MSIEKWLKAAVDDAEARGLRELKPLLEGLAQSTALLRNANFNVHADDGRAVDSGPQASESPQRPQVPTSQPVRRQAPRPGSLVTIEEFGRRLRNGQTTSVETTETCLRAIEEKDEGLNAFILVMADESRRQARQADAELAAGHDRGPLHGVPVSLKDLFDVRGVATTAASNVRRDVVAASDAPIVAHLRQAGAVVVGKTNLHEFAFGTTNEDSAWGPARHPFDPSRSPGGSSGGSAVSVAAGMALATVGTDTGGSVRIPSAACGLVGLKPTVGEVETDGVVPLSQSLDHVGPLALTVTDAWHLQEALLGGPPGRSLVAAPLSGMRLGIPGKYFSDVLDSGVRAAFEATVATLERAGARTASVDIAHADYIATIYLQIVFAEAAAYHASALERMPERYTPPVRLRLEMARYVLAEDYLRALRGQAVLRREIDAALAWHDALILPTLPIVAPKIGEASLTIDGVSHPVRNLMLRLTQPFNITGHPAVSLPCGDADGLPVGVQIVGRRHETGALMRVALAAERAIQN